MGPIKIQLRDVFGRELAYPICPKAKALVSVMGTKTLRPEQVMELTRAGFVFEYIPKVLTKEEVEAYETN